MMPISEPHNVTSSCTVSDALWTWSYCGLCHQL